MKPASLSIDSMPAWVLAEMPPGYQNRVAEIQRLASDLEAMNRFGRLLCDTGPDLAESVRSVLASLDLPTSAIEGASDSAMCVRLRAGRVFLLASPSETPLQKKSADVAAAFQILQEHADEHDRVVIVVNPEPGTPLTERGEAMTQDAAVFLKRMSIAVLTAPTMFRLWKLSLSNPDRARQQVERLHELDGGVFEVPASAFK